MRLYLLGAPRAIHLNRWKDDIAESAEGLGWHVTHVDARDIPAEDVERGAAGADLFMWARTHGHQPSGDVAGMLRRIEDSGTPTVALHMDLYWGVPHREPHIGRDPWWTCQHVFTADGGPRNWAGRGIKQHHWLPPAMGPRFLGRGAPSAGRYPYPYVFVGGCLARIHGRHRAALLRWAAQRYRGKFERYGGRTAGVWGAELSTLYASARVVLGDSAPAPFYWSDRVTNTLGRGGVLAYPRTPGLAEWGFDDNVMILYDRFDFGGLARRIETLTDGRRAELVDNALALIRGRHMWSHRLRHIVEVVGCG